MLGLRIPLAVTGAVSALAIFGGVAAAGGVSGPAFYVDGDLYRTVGTPSDFSNTGAPEHSFDTIYGFADQMNVAEAAPGDQDFNGGRWQVQVVNFDQGVSYAEAVGLYAGDNDPNVFDSAEEVEAALADGAITLTAGDSFECPVIPLPKGGPHS